MKQEKPIDISFRHVLAYYLYNFLHAYPIALNRIDSILSANEPRSRTLDRRLHAHVQGRHRLHRRQGGPEGNPGKEFCVTVFSNHKIERY